MLELITNHIVSCAEWHLESHEVDNESSGRDEENFHACVVDGNEVHEKISISHQEHNEVDFLRLG